MRIPGATSSPADELTGIVGFAARSIEALGEWGVGLFTLLETVFPPIPSEVILPLAGFVLAESPRRAEAPLPVPDSMLSVAVCVGEAAAAGTDLVQLYPEEDGHRGRNGVLLRDGETVAAVRDLPWLGSDEHHWDEAAAIPARVLLAGGLAPENVGAAIAAVRPWCVDASRSLEVGPGVKDHARIQAFVEAARAPVGVRA